MHLTSQPRNSRASSKRDAIEWLLKRHKFRTCKKHSPKNYKNCITVYTLKKKSLLKLEDLKSTTNL